MQPSVLLSALFIGGFFTLSFAGCASRSRSPAAISSPRSDQSGLTIAAVTYSPAATGQIRPDQIANTAAGDVTVDRPVDLVLRKTLMDVLGRTGFEHRGPPRRLSAEITEFLIDDLGFRVAWTLRVRYVVHDAAGTAVYDAPKVTRRTTTKFGNAASTFEDVLRLNATDLAADDTFRHAVR